MDRRELLKLALAATPAALLPPAFLVGGEPCPEKWDGVLNDDWHLAIALSKASDEGDFVLKVVKILKKHEKDLDVIDPGQLREDVTDLGAIMKDRLQKLRTEAKDLNKHIPENELNEQLEQKTKDLKEWMYQKFDDYLDTHIKLAKGELSVDSPYAKYSPQCKS